MSAVTIYVLVDPRDGDVRYVGQTKNIKTRIYQHLAARTSAYRDRWINKLKKLGVAPIVRLLHKVSSEDMPSAEKYWIAYFRSKGCRLVNLTDGGEGCVGYVASEETRAKQSVARKGKKRSPESVAKTVATKRANGDFQHSPAKRAKISASLKGRKRTAESVAKSAANRPASFSVEQRARLLAIRARPEEQVRLKEQWAAMKGKPLHPAFVAGATAAARKHCADPEWVAWRASRQKELYKRTPEHTAKITASRVRNNAIRRASKENA